MMHNPAPGPVLSATTSVAASHPVSPRALSANTSQTMPHGNPVQGQGTPLLGAQRLVTPPSSVQRVGLSNNSFMVNTPSIAPLSFTQFQQQQQPPPRSSSPGVQKVNMAPSPMQTRLSTSQTNLHASPPSQTAMMSPVPKPLPPHSSTQKIVMGVANIRPNVVQPPNMLAAHKLALPAPPASGKVGMKALPIMTTSPQRPKPGTAQSQLGAGINNNYNNSNNINSNNPPSLSPAGLQAAAHGNLMTTPLMSKNSSFARNQQNLGNSMSSISINATTHALANNHVAQS